MQLNGLMDDFIFTANKYVGSVQVRKYLLCNYRLHLDWATLQIMNTVTGSIYQIEHCYKLDCIQSARLIKLLKSNYICNIVLINDKGQIKRVEVNMTDVLGRGVLMPSYPDMV